MQQEALREGGKVPLLFYIRYLRSEESKEKGKKSQLPLISEGKQPQCLPCLLTAISPHALLHGAANKQAVGGTGVFHLFYDLE